MIINKLRSWLQVVTVKALTTVLSSTTNHHQKLPLTDIFEMMANLAMSAKETSEQEQEETTYNPAPLLRFHINAIFNLLSTAETLVTDKDNPQTPKIEAKSIEPSPPPSLSEKEQEQQQPQLLPSFYATVSNQEMVDEVNSWLNVKVLSLTSPSSPKSS